MTTLACIRYQGFLVRVVSYGRYYEWTLDGLSLDAKEWLKYALTCRSQNLKASDRHWRLVHPRYKRIEFPKRRLNNRRTRMYDPTCMPTARGHRLSAQW